MFGKKNPGSVNSCRLEFTIKTMLGKKQPFGWIKIKVSDDVGNWL